MDVATAPVPVAVRALVPVPVGAVVRAQPAVDVEQELLVEDVSIDGMCGVY